MKKHLLKLAGRIDLKYLFCALYLIFYLLGFYVIEHVLKPSHYHVLSTPLDHMIPFCEWMIFFYYAWFPFMAIAYIYTYICEKKEYLRLITFTFVGMTIFVFVSALYPNTLDIRPTHLDNSNIARVLTNFIYYMDTPTNVLPSIHVYNSIGFALAFCHCHVSLRKKQFSLFLCIMICISVFFVKQHGIIDVLAAILMAYIMYVIVYKKEHYFFKEDYIKRYMKGKS
jgi:membrane-associated phospholipid phosphatase